jgi:hypothetical protein
MKNKYRIEFLSIKDLGNEQLKELSDILKKAVTSDYIKVYPKVVTDSFLKDSEVGNLVSRFSDGRDTIFAFNGKELIGTISLLKEEVRTFNTKIGYQGQGIGRQMLELLKTKVKGNKLKVKSLLTAQFAYLSMGFKISHYQNITSIYNSYEYDVAVMYIDI